MRDLRQRERMQSGKPQQQVPANPQGNGHKNGGKLAPSAKVPVGGELWGESEEASVQHSMFSIQSIGDQEQAEVGAGGSGLGEVMAVFWEVEEKGGLA